MAEISKSGELPAGQQEVWDVIANPNRYPDWLEIHQGFQGDVPESLSEGDQFTQKVTIMGMPGEVNWTVEEADAPNQLVLNGTGPMGTKVRMTYSLSGENGSRQVTSSASYEGAALKPMASALEKSSGEAADKSIENLRSLLS